MPDPARWDFIKDVFWRNRLVELERLHCKAVRADPPRPSDLISIQTMAHKEMAEWSLLKAQEVAPPNLRLDPLRPWSEVREEASRLVEAYQTLLDEWQGV